MDLTLFIDVEKAGKIGLTPKKVQVTRGGKTFPMTVYVKSESGELRTVSALKESILVTLKKKLNYWRTERQNEIVKDGADVLDSIINYTLKKDGKSSFITDTKGNILAASVIHEKRIPELGNKQGIYVDYIAVHPAILSGKIKQKGLGKRLLLDVMKKAVRVNKPITLYALSTARGFYEKFGFKDFGKRHRYGHDMFINPDDIREVLSMAKAVDVEDKLWEKLLDEMIAYSEDELIIDKPKDEKAE